MGGRPKGLLPGPDGRPLLARLVDAGHAVGCDVVLVGEAAAYGAIAPEVPRLEDRPAGVGPLGGLAALLEAAGDRPCVALACDMPHVEAATLARLLEHAPGSAVVAPRRGDDAPWEPLLARYAPAVVRPVLGGVLEEGARSFQRLFAALEVTPLPLDAAVARALEDWDRPEDVRP